MTGQPDRLDSWKAIAEYLGRDVRTAMRWAKSHGLPVRRVAGGKGRSVFAFAHEIDAWLAGGGAANVAAPPPTSEPEPTSRSIEPAPADRRRGVMIAGVAAAAAVVIAAAALISRPSARGVDPADVRVTIDTAGVTVSNRAGVPEVVHSFDRSLLTRLVDRAPGAITVRLQPDDTAAIVFGAAFFENAVSKQTVSGEVSAITLDGRPLWRVRPEYSLRFRKDTFDGAWAVADWRLAPGAGPTRVAMTSHHWMWWASPIAIVNHDGSVGEPFVNAGWVESIAWLDEQKLVIGGFNNHRDAAVVALLDTAHMNGQTPGTAGTEYECLSCGTDAPLFYATLPRSELNRVTGSRFNRAAVEVQGDRIIVTTIEIPAEAEPAAAIYEFSRDMQLRNRSYSVSYWDWHRRLEAEGRLRHNRQSCPERDGPTRIHVWDPVAKAFR